MKRLHAIFLFPLLFGGCNLDEFPEFNPQSIVDHEQEMRELVQDISRYAKGIDSDFIIVPHSGVELITVNEQENGSPDTAYLNAIDGVNQDGVFYGFTTIDQPTSEIEEERLRAFLDIALDDGKTILVTDFATSERNIDDAYELAGDAGYISFVADGRLLDNIPDYPPEVNNVNSNIIQRLADARNFLVLTNTGTFSTPQDLVDAISDTDYDLVIIDFFFDGAEYTEEQIAQLKVKNNGRRRLLVTTMNIGQAEDDRFYWQNHWVSNPPSWLLEKDSGNKYFVNFWQQGWRNILFGDDDDYLDRILDAGFDGVLLEGIEVFEDKVFEDDNENEGE